MKTLNLRSLYAQSKALPRYLSKANTLTEERAQEIAQSFGDDLAFLRADFTQANEYAQTRIARADTRGEGLGMFHNAESLFFGYVYQLHYEGACDSMACHRREQFDE